MSNNTIYFIVTVGFMVGLAIVGILISRGIKSSEDWMVAGKSLGKIPLAGTYFATIVSATSIVSYMGYYYLQGWPGWWNAAGTLGTSMVEGRISQGVVVGDGSDVGGGASTMGTLSGGGKKRVSIGERSLLGAESGIGIALGDDCVIEAGLYVTAGSRVSVLLPGQEARVVKAAELSGVSNLLFRRNSLSGAIEVLPRAKNTVELNEALHLN